MSGLHIGGTEEGYEIGGMDNPVIKDKISNYPYIPGSSLKGKMRSMTEWIQGKVKGRGDVHTCAEPQCKVCRIFGTSAAEQHREEAAGPTRLLVRDAHLAQETLDDERYVNAGMFVTETKTENSLNRITSAANPRPMERVPRGAKFNFEMVYGVYDMGDRGRADIENLAEVATALDMLQASVLGGGGSRGSGQIALENLTARIKRRQDYEQQTQGVSLEARELSIPQFMAKIQEQLRAANHGGSEAA